MTNRKEIASLSGGPIVTLPTMEAVEGREVILTAQVLLTSLGYAAGEIDGRLSDQTIDAIRQFQRASALEVDGKLTGDLLVRLARRVSVNCDP